MKNILRKKEMTLVYIVIGIAVIVTAVNPVFMRPDNLIDMLRGNVVLAIISLGMLLAILTRGVDASVGGIVATVTVVVGQFMLNVTGNVFLAFLLGCAVGVALGLANGCLIAFLEIPPIVATLGTYSIISGLMLYFTGGSLINNIPKEFTDFGSVTWFNFIGDGMGNVIGIPIQIFFLIGLGILTWFILRRTTIGRGVYAFGGNPESAARAGFSPKKVTLFVYGYIGFLCGMAGIVHLSIMKQVDPNAFVGYDLKAVGTVILGGASVAGGEGSVSGTILGVIIFAIINNGLILMQIPSFWQQIITGAIIVFTVSFDLLQKKHIRKNLSRVDIEAEA